MTPAPPLCPNAHPSADPAARYCLVCGAAVTGAVAPPSARSVAGCGVHPDRPALIACPRCGTFACGECRVQHPDGGELCAACSARQESQLPWDRRETLGTLKAFWQTSTALLARPTLTLEMASPHGSIGSSLWYAILATITASLTTVGIYAFFGIAMAVASPGTVGWEGVGIVAVIVVGLALLIVGAGAGATLANAALDHVVLRCVGARPRSFAVTLRGTSLSLAPALIALIPFCGVYVYAVWALVVRVLAYRHLHGISAGRAALGALAIPGILFSLLVTFYAIAIGMSLAELPGPTD